MSEPWWREFNLKKYGWKNLFHRVESVNRSTVSVFGFLIRTVEGEGIGSVRDRVQKR